MSFDIAVPRISATNSHDSEIFVRICHISECYCRPDTLRSMNILVGVLGRQSKYEEAESMHRQTLAMRKKVLSVDHTDTLTSGYSLANRHCYSESTVLYKRACARFATVLGEDHPTTRACRILSYSKRDN
jgi:hypothetical protein